ncbi:MAG: hypothetical protein IKR17_13360 [Bacteroidales bacterium]|nr:hypothetical protein [Bacteroidales bacterium]
MNKSQIYNAIDNCATLDEAAITQLTEVVADFPTFEIGWMLLLKALHANGSLRYTNELHRGAIHITNRAALYDLIHKKRIEETAESRGESLERKDENVEVIETKAEQILPEEKPAEEVAAVQDDYFASLGVDVDEEAAVFDFGTIEQQSTYSLDEEENKLQTELSNMKSGSFTDWLDYVNVQSDEKKTTTPQNARQRNMDLIDSFISSTQPHRIIVAPVEKAAEPEAAQESSDAADDFSAEQPSILTETLARIYIKQHKYDKAINIFSKLKLKNPDKSAYFAAQISELRKKLNDK